MTPTYERITAEDIRPGDLIASTRTQPFVRVEAVESVGAASRYLRLDGGDRIRPRHTTKLWRAVV